jgi:4-amino-4-deoxy-L-arabinose transferase
VSAEERITASRLTDRLADRRERPAFGSGGGSAPRASCWLLAGLCLLTWSLAFQGSRPLWDPDEGRYTAVALAMLDRGDFVIPVLADGQPHVTKPPLTYRAIAGAVHLLGRSEWSVRLPNALAFTATGVLLLALGRRAVPRRAWLPALVHAVTALPFGAAAIATTDTLLTTWETAAMTCYVAALCDPRPRRRRALGVGLWISLGLAFLTKGPPGLLPLAAIAAFAILARGSVDLPRMLSPIGLACFAPIAFGWFVAADLRKPGLIEHLIRYEVVDRVATDLHHRNPGWWGALLAYGPVFLLGTLPWTPICVGALRGARSWLRPAAWRAACARDPLAALLACWLVVPLVVFLVARSRLPFYLLPLFVPLSLLIARHLDARSALASRRRVSQVAAWALLLLAGKLVSAHLHSHKDARDYARFIRSVAQGPLDEIAFIDTHRHYGLAFYLGVEVESVTLIGPLDWQGGLGRVENLEETLVHAGRRVFVVQEDDRAAFAAECRRLRASARLLGQRDQGLIYSIGSPPGP